MQSIQKNLNASRDAIKGFAILWVVFFHAQLGLSGVLYDIQKIGYGGVDIFMFLSGYGLYHSLNKDNDLGRYLKRRAFRLLPVYLPFCLLWLAVMVPLCGAGKVDLLRIVASNLTMTGYFASSPLQINWYLSMLMLTVLLAPVFYVFIQPGKKDRMRIALLMTALFTVGIAYFRNTHNMALSRLPVFALGMIFARPYEKQTTGRSLKYKMIIAAIIGFAMVYLCFAYKPKWLSDYAMYWYPFVLITPALCSGLGWLFGKSWFIIRKPMELLGRASFEIFLFNAWLEVLGKFYGLVETPAEWAIASLVSIGLGIGYHLLVSKIVQKVVDKRA